MRERLNAAMKRSMKDKDVVSLATIRLIMAALKDRDIAARGEGRVEGVSDDEVLQLLQSMIKQRKESIRMYKEGGREELADREMREIKVIESFLPDQMDETQIRAATQQSVLNTSAAGIRDMGKVMADLKQRYAGRMDFAVASRIVKETLSATG